VGGSKKGASNVKSIYLIFQNHFKTSETALIALVLAGAARADTIKEFVVSGTR
jgi:hypothetical protein